MKKPDPPVLEDTSKRIRKAPTKFEEFVLNQPDKGAIRPNRIHHWTTKCSRTENDHPEPAVETPTRPQKRKLILSEQESAMEGEGIFPDSEILSHKKKFRGPTDWDCFFGIADDSESSKHLGIRAAWVDWVEENEKSQEKSWPSEKG